MADTLLYDLAERAGHALEQQRWLLTTAESCTGGWVAEAITMVPGSSAWFDRGFVTYTNTSKREMLGVRSETLEQHGAVSEAVVREMVAGALEASQAHVAIAVSGVAGPGGGTPQKPVGTVCLAWGVKDSPARTETRHFTGDREAVRRQSVVHALEVLIEELAQRASGEDRPESTRQSAAPDAAE
jgi:nicotinamide-nucleotide amidase